MLKYLVIASLLSFTPIMASTPGLPNGDLTEFAHPLGDNGVALVSDSGPIGIGSVNDIATDPKAVYIKQVTAYSSSPDETDDTPFITALGTHVRSGTAAANWLPFGAKIRVPEIFGDRIFTIEDRMNDRFSDRVDVWFPEKNQAKNFGVHALRVEVL